MKKTCWMRKSGGDWLTIPKKQNVYNRSNGYGKKKCYELSFMTIMKLNSSNETFSLERVHKEQTPIETSETETLCLNITLKY